jgi:hydrogenase expression/formation protein HypE
MRDLLANLFFRYFDNPLLRQRHDAAVADWGGGSLAFTTDSYVVKPLFFPGGDIGKLAVYGTVNDLAMAGARPLWLSAAFILEEGFPLTALEKVVSSMADAARECGVDIVTGDTKVVDRGCGDGLFITTAGVGRVSNGCSIGPSRIEVGDIVLLSGDLGRHGIAVMSARENLDFNPPIVSDAAPLHELIDRLLRAGIELHCLRDLTRGGLAAAANEIADEADLGLELREADIAVAGPVRAACELLGLDPLYVANEGRFLAILPPAAASEAIAVLGAAGAEPALVGVVCREPRGQVNVQSPFGTSRPLDLLSGEQLPRIC